MDIKIKKKIQVTNELLFFIFYKLFFKQGVHIYQSSLLFIKQHPSTMHSNYSFIMS
jgi:hypothetical protein